MACVISPMLLRQTPFCYTETLMRRRCNVWQPRMTDEHGLNWHDDTVCCFDLPFCLQNGPVINLERSLKADELICTATQLRSLPLFVWPISPFMSWDPQLSATLVSTVPFFFWTILILIILLNWFLQVPLRPVVRFWAGNAIMGNRMTFCVGNLLMNQHPFGWELSLTVVGLEAHGFISVLNSKCTAYVLIFPPFGMFWACFWRRESFAVVWENMTVIYLGGVTWDFLADCVCSSRPGWFWQSECRRN